MKRAQSEGAPHSPSRREFLVSTASVAGAGMVLAACATTGAARSGPLPKAARRTPLGPDEPIRMGVIGTGGMGTAHCGSITTLANNGKENVHIVALADVCQPRLQAAHEVCTKAQPGVDVATYGDYLELLARDDLHGVLIAVPEHSHAGVAEDAIAHGKDVYLEKPMTLRLAEAQRLHDVADANPDVIVQIGTQFTMQGKYRAAQKLIRDGAIGKPTWSQTGYCRNSKEGEWKYYAIDPEWEPGVNLDWKRWCGRLWPQPWDPEVYARWRRYRTFSTGIIGDLLVHVTTPMMMAIDQGWPVRVVATGGHYVDTEMENHDQVNIQVELEKGHTLTICGSTCNEQGVETMVRGHKASLYLGGKDCVLRPERIYAEEVEEQKIECEAVQDQDELRLEWLRCIRTREPNTSTVALGHQVMVMVDLATRSMWEGGAFEYDPESKTARAV